MARTEHKKWLATPEGWVQGDLLLRTLSRPPRKGSPRWVALSYMRLRQEEIDHAKLRAIAQLLLEPSKGKDAFDEYMKVAFPYLAAVRDRELEDISKVLKEELKRGLLQVAPIAPTARAVPGAATPTPVSDAVISQMVRRSKGVRLQ